MDRFLEMQTFRAVIDAGSFVGAAQALGLSKASVSRHVGALEERLGVRLLNRTTRRLSLTDDGEVFNARCREILGNLDEAEAEVGARGARVQGLLRINAPLSFGIRRLAPLWGAFRARHPEVRLDISLADRQVDLVEEGYDLAIRIARLPDSSLVSRRLGTTRVVLCASPEYLEAHGIPKHPHQLADHAVITYGHAAAGEAWKFDGPKGEIRLRVDGCIHSNNGDTCRAAALAHQGIAMQPTFLVGEDLEAGRLVRLLPEYGALELGIYAIYPSRKHLAPKVRAMVDFLAERFADTQEA